MVLPKRKLWDKDLAFLGDNLRKQKWKWERNGKKPNIAWVNELVTTMGKSTQCHWEPSGELCRMHFRIIYWWDRVWDSHLSPYWLEVATQRLTSPPKPSTSAHSESSNLNRHCKMFCSREMEKAGRNLENNSVSVQRSCLPEPQLVSELGYGMGLNISKKWMWKISSLRFICLCVPFCTPYL